MPPTRWIRILIGLPIAGLFAWLAFRGLGAQDLGALRDCRPAWVATAVAALALGYGLRIARWWLMLRRLAPGIPCQACAAPFLASFALNNVLPLRAGDVVRTVAFCRRLGVPVAGVLATMLVERLLDLVSLLLVLACAVVLVGPASLPTVVGAAGLAAAGAALGGAVALLAMPGPLLALLGRMLGRILPARLAARLVPAIAQLAEGLMALRGPGHILLTLLLSLGAWLAEGTVFLCVCLALGAIPGWSAWLALGLANLATLIPSTPGHVGTFDYFAILGLTLGGVPQAQAQVATLGIHLVIWAPITIVGLGALLLIRAGKDQEPAHA